LLGLVGLKRWQCVVSAQLKRKEVAVSLRILLTICAIIFICGERTPDVHAVSLADLITTNGSITGAGGNLRLENFTANISAQGDVSPTTLDQVSVFGGGQSIQFIGPFTARSPAIGPNDPFSAV
jgi:hypothetical protein